MSTPLTQIDFYEADHRSQYPDGTEVVFSNWTPRKSRIDEIDRVVLFGLQYFCAEYLVHRWNAEFFDRSKDQVVARYQRRMTNAGINISVDHIEALHDLGFLPLEIRALPEGSRVPIGVPIFVMWDTRPRVLMDHELPRNVDLGDRLGSVYLCHNRPPLPGHPDPMGPDHRRRPRLHRLARP